jgi:hypothetical protein
LKKERTGKTVKFLMALYVFQGGAARLYLTPVPKTVLRQSCSFFVTKSEGWAELWPISLIYGEVRPSELANNALANDLLEIHIEPS